MGTYVIKLPDVGEGLAEAELVQWEVAVGDPVKEDMVIAAVMTDKATVDIPSPVAGTVLALGADVGEVLAIGAELIRLEVAGEGNTSADAVPVARAAPAEPVAKPAQQPESAARAAPADLPAHATAQSATPAARRKPGEKPLASPSVRKRALDAGVDLRQVTGSGPTGQITHDDLERHLAAEDGAGQASAGPVKNTSVSDVKVIGLRRKIAEKMVLSKTRIPHITYVEEVDMTKLEELRAALNGDKAAEQTRLTILPFLMQAMVKAAGEQPGINATFDDEAGVVHQYGGVHIGVAAQTEKGLVVPVIHHAEALDVWASASELARLVRAANDGTITRDELAGSTITITSLGAMGGIVTTPVINHPEVAIVGVNKMVMRPMWDGSQFVPRKMMNLSASFDHRIVDGWDAAKFVQRIKTLLETPAMIFMAS